MGAIEYGSFMSSRRRNSVSSRTRSSSAPAVPATRSVDSRASGALREVHHHVYAAAGVPRGYGQSVLAAVLAAGKHAFASHETGARLLELPLPGPAALEVTTLYERCPKIPGVRVHRSGRLEDRLVTSLGPIPVASVELVIVGLSSRHSLTDLGKMTDEALRRGLTTTARIDVRG